MTTYTFNPTTKTQSTYWDDPAIWAGGVVPNSPDADVVFPIIFSNGSPYSFDIGIKNGEVFSIQSLTMNSDTLVSFGSLTVLQFAAVNNILLGGGTLTAGSLRVD